MMIGSLGSEEFVEVMAAWGIKKQYIVKDEEDARKALWSAIEDNVRILVVEGEFDEVIRSELKIIRSEYSEKVPIIVYLPGPSWKKLSQDPVEILMREAIGIRLRGEGS
ncbi:MAG TPA: hypothetical protein ENK81_01795 [Euryarchaeota archaeon]|nr:hypothetical protein [Euryarchaeota archaeon]